MGRLGGHSHPVAAGKGAGGIRGIGDLLARCTRQGRRSLLGGLLLLLLLALILVLVPVVRRLSDSLSVLLVLVDGPVKDVVVLESLANKQVTEDLAQVAVVRLVIEAKRPGVVEVDGKLIREATAEHIGGSGHLLLHDTVILLLLGGSLQTLPGEGATAEVKHDVAERLHIVTAGLLDTKVGVDRGITGRAGQVLVLPVRDMEVRLGIAVLLGETEVDDVDLVATLANAHQEVVGLDVAVDEGLGVDVLDTGDELVSQQQDGLQGELAVAEVEKVLKTGTEKVENHGIVVALSAEPADKGNADTASKRLVDAGFILKLRVLGLDTLELDGDLFTRDDVSAEVDITKRARANLAADAVLVADTQVLLTDELARPVFPRCFVLPTPLDRCQIANDSANRAVRTPNWSYDAQTSEMSGLLRTKGGSCERTMDDILAVMRNGCDCRSQITASELSVCRLSIEEKSKIEDQNQKRARAAGRKINGCSARRWSR
mgnify:CR=1 FL=1